MTRLMPWVALVVAVILPLGLPNDYYLRLTSDGTNGVGHYSTDGTTWIDVGKSRDISLTGLGNSEL